MSDKVSVIVPCYRGEQHVGAMLRDLCCQTYTNFEILVVGNGPDQDAQRVVVEEWNQRDNRVRYLSLAAAGVSRARNAGIDAATGDWIAFVDDDDRVPEDWLARFVVHFDRRPDVIAGGIRCKSFGATKPIDTDVDLSSQSFLYSDDPKEFLPVFSSDIAVRYSPCSKVIRRNFLNEHAIRFDETLTVCEDCVFSQQLAITAKSMCFIPQTGYLYVARKGSAAGRFHESMELALVTRRRLLCQVARRSGKDDSECEEFRRSQVLADSLDVFLNAFRKGTPYGFLAKVRILKRLFAESDFVQSCRGSKMPWDNKPLFAYLFFYRLRTRVLCVLFFELMFSFRDLMRSLL